MKTPIAIFVGLWLLGATLTARQLAAGEAAPAPTLTPVPDSSGAPEFPPEFAGMKEEELESYTGEADVSAPYPLRPFRLGVDTQLVANGFDLTPKDQSLQSKRLNYRPASSNYFGVILGYKWLGGTVSFGVPAGQSTQAVEGTSQYNDYRLSFYHSSFGIEAALSRYEGYLIDNSSILSASTLNGATYYKIPDLETIGFGLNFMYVFRPDRFSLPAALDQTAVQAISGGSALLLATWREQWIETVSTSPLIPTQMRPYFGVDADVDRIRSRTVAVGPGYGYYLTHNALFASLLAAVTVGYQHVDYDTDGTSPSDSSAALNFHLRGGLGINSQRYFLTASFYLDRFTQYTQTIDVGDTLYGLTLATGIRF